MHQAYTVIDKLHMQEVHLAALRESHLEAATAEQILAEEEAQDSLPMFLILPQQQIRDVAMVDQV